MKKMTYRGAILSFCEDLTDPDARSLPVGVLLIGDLDGSRFGAAIVLQPKVDNIFVSEHLSDALAIVKEHITDVMKEKPEAAAEDVLHELYLRLRNSLFVSSIGDEQQVEVHAAMEELYDMSLVEVAAGELGKELQKAVAATRQAQPTSAARVTPRPVRSQSEVWSLQELAC